jgi:D-arabinose 1-dehydrogenase-like Zn-dependent alcohol dehydrogenase
MRRSRAVVLRRFGEPLVLDEFDVPPAPEGGLVVASTYGGMCGTDIHLQRGHLDVPTPLVLGHEGLGVVQELGPNLQRDVNGEPLREGDRVMWASSIACGRCRPCVVHRDSTLCVNRQTYGVNRPTTAEPALSGSWADCIYLRAGTTVVRVGDRIDPLDAMSLGGHLVQYVRLLPRLLERFHLGDLVTIYPLEDHAIAMRDVANGSVMKAVFVSGQR